MFGTHVCEELNKCRLPQQGFIYTYFIYKTHKAGHTTNTKMIIYKEIQRWIQEE